MDGRHPGGREGLIDGLSFERRWRVWVLLRAGQSSSLDGMAQSRGRLHRKASVSSEVGGLAWRSERQRRPGVFAVARERPSWWCRAVGADSWVNPGQGTCQARYQKDTSFFLPQRETEVKDQGI